MTTLLIILHVLAAIAIIAFVLLQKGKGADMGLMGGSDSILGTGGANFLIKVTAAAAVIFLSTGLILAVVQTKGYTEGGSVVDSFEVPQQPTPSD